MPGLGNKIYKYTYGVNMVKYIILINKLLLMADFVKAYLPASISINVKIQLFKGYSYWFHITVVQREITSFKYR